MTLSAQGDSVRVFEDADVYYASGLRTFPIWGAYGVALLRRLELLIRRRLTELGYAEIALPALCRLDALEAFVGDKKRHLFEVEDGRRPALALSPFSELQYIEHLQSRSTRPPYLARVFQWSRRYVREAGSGALDFGEYVKCEAFSVHNGARDAVAAGAVLAQAFRDFCVSDLALSPIFGERPRRTAFPGAEATWSAELPLPGGDLQTLIVSHRMHTSFFAANGFDMPSGARLNSACFSQKLLTAVLLHHRDLFGFRIPPALAPTLGVVMGGAPTRPDMLASNVWSSPTGSLASMAAILCKRWSAAEPHGRSSVSNLRSVVDRCGDFILGGPPVQSRAPSTTSRMQSARRPVKPMRWRATCGSVRGHGRTSSMSLLLVTTSPAPRSLRSP